jgi:hypothetical protein
MPEWKSIQEKNSPEKQNRQYGQVENPIQIRLPKAIGSAHNTLPKAP